MSNRFKSVTSVLAFTLLSFIAVADVMADVVISDAYVREPIPGRNMSAAFMQIKNTGSEDLVLVNARADWTESIEIHTHKHEDGVMRMRQIDSLSIPAGGEVTLQPGGLHLMLLGLKQPLAQQLPLTLCFADGDCLETQVQLRIPSR